MKPLLVLTIAFAISIFAIKSIKKSHDFQLSARIAMCVMLCFTAIGHFAFTKGMTMMIPSVIPFKTQIVHLTGLLEILLGIGLLIPKFKNYSAWLLILFFIALLPANIYAAIQHIDYQRGTLDGNGPSYLWFRVPLQLFFMAWVYLSSIK